MKSDINWIGITAFGGIVTVLLILAYGSELLS